MSRRFEIVALGLFAVACRKTVVVVEREAAPPPPVSSAPSLDPSLTLLARQDQYVEEIFDDGDAIIYGASNSDNLIGDWVKIRRLPKSGGTPVDIVELGIPNWLAFHVDVDGTAYWYGKGNDLHRRTRNGDRDEVFAAFAGPVDQIATDATDVYVLAHLKPSELVEDAKIRVHRISKTKTPRTATIVADDDKTAVSGLVVTRWAVYWHRTDGTLRQLTKGTTKPVSLGAGYELRADDDGAVIKRAAGSVSSDLVSVGNDGKGEQLLAHVEVDSGSVGVNLVALDRTSVIYWTGTGMGGSVHRVARARTSDKPTRIAGLDGQRTGYLVSGSLLFAGVRPELTDASTMIVSTRLP